MAALKEKALALLGSATVTMTAASGVETIFTVPVGKVARISHLVVRDPSASLASGTSFQFGTGFRNNAAVDLSSMTTLGTDYMVLQNATSVGNDQKSTEIASAVAFQITKTTGSAAAATAVIDVFGYLT